MINAPHQQSIQLLVFSSSLQNTLCGFDPENGDRRPRLDLVPRNKGGVFREIGLIKFMKWGHWQEHQIGCGSVQEFKSV